MLALLSQNPAAYVRVIAEVDDVLGGRDPHAPDVDALPWTQAVVSEALRLYPPAYHIHRDAAQDDDISGIPVSPATPSEYRRIFFTAIPNSGRIQSDSIRNGSCPAARPPVRDMRISRSAAVAASAWARVWPSWS